MLYEGCLSEQATYAQINVVLQFLWGMGKATELSIKELTLKLVMLIALTTACREQTTHLLDLKGLVKENNCLVFIIDSNIKQSRPIHFQTA